MKRLGTLQIPPDKMTPAGLMVLLGKKFADSGYPLKKVIVDSKFKRDGSLGVSVKTVKPVFFKDADLTFSVTDDGTIVKAVLNGSVIPVTKAKTFDEAISSLTGVMETERKKAADKAAKAEAKAAAKAGVAQVSAADRKGAKKPSALQTGKEALAGVMAELETAKAVNERSKAEIQRYEKENTQLAGITDGLKDQLESELNTTAQLEKQLAEIRGGN